MSMTTSTALLALSMLLAPLQQPAVPGETGGAADSAAPVPAMPMERAAVEQGPAPTGLPQWAPPPRTMEAHWPVFLLFGITWIAIVGYLMMTARRVSRFAEALRELEARR